MRFLPLFLGLLLALAASGCAPGNFPGLMPDAEPERVDSLRSENAALRARLRQVQDTLSLRRDVQTGQYYRERRVLQDQLNRLTYEARTLRDGGRTVRVLPADSLFESATATLTAAGTNRLRSVLSHLQAVYPTRTIRVEGHADNAPLSASLQERFASNWELSAARASAVVRHLIDQGDLDPTQFVVVAYGSTDPVASNETVRGRRRNRRVRIAVLPPPRDYSRPFETAW
jgi:chemotaxis protein MotB